jgi:hypothetical protein
MDKTRASLRRVRVYAVLIVVCLLFAGLPQTRREINQQRAQYLTSAAVEWVAHHLGGK